MTVQERVSPQTRREYDLFREGHDARRSRDRWKHWAINGWGLVLVMLGTLVYYSSTGALCR